MAEIRVEGAASEPEAKAIARRIATSPLVKTALFGHDANWGRILAAAGSAPFNGGYAHLDPDRGTLELAGVRGLDGGVPARRVPELGLVGDPLPSRPAAVLEAFAAARIPVVAPLAEGPLNVNADEAAAALAVGLGADRLVFVTDVPGVLHHGEVLERIEARD